MDSSRMDDEHKLIARYAQRLAQEARTVVSRLTWTLLMQELSPLCQNEKGMVLISVTNSINSRIYFHILFTASCRFQNVTSGSNGEYDNLKCVWALYSFCSVLNDFFHWLIFLQQGRAPSDANLSSLETSRAQRELISQLEAKNKEIMREIARLRYTCVV